MKELYEIACSCGKQVHVSKLTDKWIHTITKDTWCDPKQNQFAWMYNLAKPVFRKVVQ